KEAGRGVCGMSRDTWAVTRRRCQRNADCSEIVRRAGIQINLESWVRSTLALTQAFDRQNHTLGGFLQQTAYAASPSMVAGHPAGPCHGNKTKPAQKVKCGLALPVRLSRSAQAYSANKHFITWLSRL